MSARTSLAQNDESPKHLIQMALHLTTWGIGLIELLDKNIQQEFAPTHSISRRHHQQQLESFVQNFGRTIAFMRVSDCKNGCFLKWLETAHEFKKTMAVLVRRCAAVKSSRGFLQLARAVTKAAKSNLLKMEEQLKAIDSGVRAVERNLLRWDVPKIEPYKVSSKFAGASNISSQMNPNPKKT